MGSGRVEMAWAPFPSAWQQVYAYIHETCFFRSHPNEPFDKPHDLKLVDAGAHTVIRSWTAEDLRQLACRRVLRSTPPYGQLCKVKCLPNGKHLAVFCRDNSVSILTFGSV